MARVTVEDCLDKVPSRFSLVIMVAKRAKQLMKGAEQTVAAKGNKVIVSALREVAAGNITLDVGTEMHPLLQVERDLNRKSTEI